MLSIILHILDLSLVVQECGQRSLAKKAAEVDQYLSSIFICSVNYIVSRGVDKMSTRPFAAKVDNSS